MFVRPNSFPWKRRLMRRSKITDSFFPLFNFSGHAIHQWIAWLFRCESIFLIPKGCFLPKPVPYDEKELLLRVAEGNQQAFRMLYDRYVQHVYGIALQLMKSPELAQDLAQEIFVKVWIKRTTLTEVEQFRPWLNTITRNLARDYLRKKVIAPEYEPYLLGFFADLSPSAEEELAHRQLQQVMNEAIDQLSPQLKTAFTLSRFRGLTHEQIAQEMQISPTTSKSHLVRALASIRSYLKKYYPEVAIVVTVLLSPRG